MGDNRTRYRASRSVSQTRRLPARPCTIKTRRASAVRPRAGEATATRQLSKAAAMPPPHHPYPQRAGHGSSRHSPRKRRRRAGPCAVHSRAG